MQNRLIIGLVGAGVVAQRRHLPAIRGVPEVRAEIIMDANSERAESFAKQNGFPRWTTDINEFADCVDLAIVAVPNGAHAMVSSQLLSKGIHILCEKPMARTVAECQGMIEAARQSCALLAIGHNRRYQSHIQLVRRLLKAGLIGEIERIEAEEGSLVDWPRSPAYFDPVESGGGCLIDVGIHSIDLIRWMASEFVSIEYIGNSTPEKVESDAELRFRLQSGALGRVGCSRERELAQRLLITGSEGFIEAGLWSGHLRIRSDKGKPFRHFPCLEGYVSRRPPADPSFVDQLRNLVGAIRGEEEVLVTGEEGMAAVNVVCRAYATMAAASSDLITKR